MKRVFPVSALLLSLTLTPGASMAEPPTAPPSPATPPTATRHEPNRLVHETSPYLLQHAHNPVDWYPWGEEAFEAARTRQVPILLSVGYSTCYWCHVMERDCFENPSIAEQMNANFVCIKVDREERPDVDSIYMTALQILTRSGGWPMNMFLTPPGAKGPDDPGLEPFFGGTYFPPEARQGQVSFPELLRNVTIYWHDRREQMIEQADRLTEAVRSSVAETGATVRVDESQISEAFATLTGVYDKENGGFGRAPKFPQPVYLEFLLDTLHTLQDPAVRESVIALIRHTLDAMQLGGIHDQVGGGFHRYATDEKWIIPHFEKMLYDNAQLASLYATSYRRGSDPEDARIVRDILNYVQREMTAPSGMFYSAQDAEVDGYEGLNYLWTFDQMVEVLGPDDAAFAADIYSVSPEGGGNFRDPHHPGDPAKSVLVLRARPDELAKEKGISVESLLKRKRTVDAGLYAARAERKQPALDDKIVTSWNGLMIAGFADGALVLGDEQYLNTAERAAKSVLTTMRSADGQLLRTERNGVAKTPGFLEDYAYLVHGLLAVHRTNAAAGRADLTYLNAAHRLTKEALKLFSDGSGGLYDTLPGQSDLIVRTRSPHDGAMPSPTSVMLHNLLDIHDLTQDPVMLRAAVELMGSISSDVRESPVGTINSVRALYRLMRLDPSVADRYGPREAAGGAGAGVADDGADAVKVMAPGERVTVPEEGFVELPLRIEIDPGYHINAHDPGVAGMTGLTVGVEGSDAVRVDVLYPAGQAYTGAAAPAGETLMVHEGAVELTLRLSRTGKAWSGRPIILVTYQACTDSACLRPRTVELDVAIDQ